MDITHYMMKGDPASSVPSAWIMFFHEHREPFNAIDGFKVWRVAPYFVKVGCKYRIECRFMAFSSRPDEYTKDDEATIYPPYPEKEALKTIGDTAYRLQ